MRRRPPRSTRTDTLFPYTTLVRSNRRVLCADAQDGTVRHHAIQAVVRPRGRDDDHFAFGLGQTAVLFHQRIDIGKEGPKFGRAVRSEEHTSELQSLMRISYAVFCLKKKNITITMTKYRTSRT